MIIEKNTLYDFVGDLTVCWTDIHNAGAFEATEASAIVSRLRRHINDQVSAVLTEHSGLGVEQINTLTEKIMERL